MKAIGGGLAALTHWFLLTLGGLGVALMLALTPVLALKLAFEVIRSLRSAKRPSKNGEDNK